MVTLTDSAFELSPLVWNPWLGHLELLYETSQVDTTWHDYVLWLEMVTLTGSAFKLSLLVWNLCVCVISFIPFGIISWNFTGGCSMTGPCFVITNGHSHRLCFWFISLSMKSLCLCHIFYTIWNYSMKLHRWMQHDQTIFCGDTNGHSHRLCFWFISLNMKSLTGHTIWNYFMKLHRWMQLKETICCDGERSLSSQTDYCRCSKTSNTSCLPKTPRQTVQSQIRLLLKKQSDQGLPCLLFWQAFCEFQPWKPTFYLRTEREKC